MHSRPPVILVLDSIKQSNLMIIEHKKATESKPAKK